MKKKMTKNLAISLGAIGATIVSGADAKAYHANEAQELPMPEMEFENVDVQADTLNAIRDIAENNAFLVDENDGVVYIDTQKLPDELKDKILSSDRSLGVPDSSLVELESVFTEALVKKNGFNRTGTLQGIIINQIMLEKLKDEANPILEEDLKDLLASNYF